MSWGCPALHGHGATNLCRLAVQGSWLGLVCKICLHQFGSLQVSLDQSQHPRGYHEWEYFPGVSCRCRWINLNSWKRKVPLRYNQSGGERERESERATWRISARSILRIIFGERPAHCLVCLLSFPFCFFPSYSKCTNRNRNRLSFFRLELVLLYLWSWNFILGFSSITCQLAKP